jgi:hypothetical protein
MHAPQLSEFGNSTLSTTATVLGHSRTGSSVAKAMSSAGSALARAECAIALLCDAYDAGVGHLYLLAPDGEANLAASFGAESPSDRLRFEIGEFIRREREDASAPTQYVADTNTALSSAETIFSDERGTRYRPVLLSSHHEGAAVDVGVAVLRCSEHSEHSVSRPQLAAALAAQLLQAGDTRGARADSD